MPIYGYRCEQCGHEVEVLQGMSEAPLRICPSCMGPLRKMVYPAGIIFKGSGYYTTDYKTASADKSDRGGEGGGEAVAKDGGKEGSKEAAKSDSKGGSAEPAKPAKTARPAA